MRWESQDGFVQRFPGRRFARSAFISPWMAMKPKADATPDGVGAGARPPSSLREDLAAARVSPATGHLGGRIVATRMAGCGMGV